MVDLPESVLVIAYGNPQRGDDGVAWRVLDSLRAAPARPDAPPLRLKRVHQLVPELAEPVSRARALVFVDACADGPVGAVRCEPVEAGAGATSLTHALSPAAVLLYSERLFGRAPRAAIVTIGGARLDHGSELSPEALQAVPKAVRRIRSLARLWAHESQADPASACARTERPAAT